MKKLVALLGSAVLMVALALIVSPSIALAHAQIASCTPPINGQVATAPATLACTTIQAMVAQSSSLKVYDASGAEVDKGDSAVDLNDPNRESISVSLDPTKMKDGVYTVKWATLSADDGDAADGSFTFTVGAPATPSQTGTPLAPTPFAGKIVVADPSDGDTVSTGPNDISVAVEGVTLGDLYRWHVYLDGTDQGMVTGGASTVSVNIPDGKHTIKVALADATHDELASAQIDVTAAAATATPTSTATATPTSQPNLTPTSACAWTTVYQDQKVWLQECE